MKHILLCLSVLSCSLYASEEFFDEVLSFDRLDVHKTFETLDTNTPIWVSTKRQYGAPYMKDRTHIFKLEDVLHRVVVDGFPIQYTLQELFRAKMGIHTQIGNLLPQLSVDFGQGITQFGLTNIASNVFAFVLPSNWLQLGSSIHMYKAARLLLLKSVLDEMLAAKTIFYNLHQNITDFEILSFYFAHIKAFAKKYPPDSRELATLEADAALLQNDSFLRLNEMTINYNALARMMSIDKLDKTYTAKTIHIEEFSEIQTTIDSIFENINKNVDKETVLDTIVKNSLELRIFKRLYKISKLKIGIVASGATLASLGHAGGVSEFAPRFSANFGYGTLPQTLTAVSRSKTSRLDIKSAYLDLLTTNRVALDRYVGLSKAYKQFQINLNLNRKAFKKNLEHFKNTSAAPDALFIRSLTQLVQSELTLNAVMHTLLRTHIIIERYLLKEESQALHYLPQEGEILHQFTKFKEDKINDLVREDESDEVFKNVRKTEELNKVLYHHREHPKLSHLTDEELAVSVKYNIGNLLFSKLRFYKRRSFYKLLSKYIFENKIELSEMEHYLLVQKQASKLTRLFKNKSLYKGERLHTLDFR